MKNLPAMQETQEMRVQSLSWKDTLEEKMATQSSILAWKMLWTEEPGGLQSMGSHKESDTTEATEHTQPVGRVSFWADKKHPRSGGSDDFPAWQIHYRQRLSTLKWYVM